ncbi:MAG TPA: tRNA uridine-5-carboxymethylaminomethyl(34) synthesis GTPase MnmE [Candidatus Deferrimicrobium sp.]|nr:tRNA uridine-5-carboxymethylaminomethyl(34) synthesis GTPase MnmE [Candidatus Deferrimicrobium sp.]
MYILAMEGDTIAALSTPLGKGGIAVIRISGALTKEILQEIIGPLPVKIIPRHAYHGFVRDTENNRRIDECITVFYKAPHSYTGEDAAEISIHSNPFIVEEVLNLIFRRFTGVRNALPGEFTYRAFKNDKMDLIQAESVNELINANSKYYAHIKFGSLEGRLSRFMEELKEELIDLGVRIETKIEFEEDQFFDGVSISGRLQEPLKRLDNLLTNARFNDLLDKGLNVVIAGKVNVGKSSLFNTLLMEERSIISATPGTTRDFIKEKLYIDGFPVDITDVAGINRDTGDDIEMQGIRRSLQKLASCDAVIFMLDASRPIEQTDQEIYELIKGKKKLLIANKTDIAAAGVIDAIAACFKEEKIIHVSVKQHMNIDAVTSFLEELVADVRGKESDFTVNRRQKGLLEELRDILLRVKQMMENSAVQVEIIAEEIRRALDIIGQLLGKITPEDILNKIFSEFCVGK